MITENLSTLKIHKLTQEQYDRELAAGNIDANALYLTPEEEVDLSVYATVEQVSKKADLIHSHNDQYYTEAEIDAKLETKANSDHSHPTDTSRAAKTDLDSHTSNTTVHITSAERSNWNAAKAHADSAHAPSNAEKNQNAFSNVTVGSTTIAADSVTDTLTLVAGTNVTLTPDATGDSINIAAKDTTYSAGTGISLSGTVFSNAGVRSISTGSSNGTISVNINGTSADVAVKGLGSAAYTASTAYDSAGSANDALATANTYTDNMAEQLSEDIENLKVFCVTVTDSTDSLVADKTFDEIVDAYESGKVVSVAFNATSVDGRFRSAIAHLSQVTSSACLFHAVNAPYHLMLTINSSNEVTSNLYNGQTPSPYALTFTGAVEGTYNGSKEVTIDIPSVDDALNAAKSYTDEVASVKADTNQVASLHVWRNVSNSYAISKGSTISMEVSRWKSAGSVAIDSAEVVYYSNSIAVEDGALALSGNSSVTANSLDKVQTLLGKYIKISDRDNYYFIPSDATFAYEDTSDVYTSGHITVDKAQVVTFTEVSTTNGYVCAESSDAYSGNSYEYIGQLGDAFSGSIDKQEIVDEVLAALTNAEEVSF